MNTTILSILYKANPENVYFIMINSKFFEFSIYERISHLLIEIVTDMKDTANAVRWRIN
ncbi:MAG: FtsK/SpoIIIE domain-containing protein [Arsenophonus sp. NC-XBC3-MAG3]